MSARTTLVGTIVGASVALAGMYAWTDAHLPKISTPDQSRLYNYTYVDGKSNSVAWMSTHWQPDSYLSFGSSEFYIARDLVPEVPQVVFGEHNYGVDLTYIGEAYEQMLWQLIAAGAYEPVAPHNKIMLILSPQWFFKGNGAQSKFFSKYNSLLYRSFVDNDKISDDIKAYVRKRLSELGISGDTLAAVNRDDIFSAIDGEIDLAQDRIKYRQKLPEIISKSPTLASAKTQESGEGEPDWNALLAQARIDGQEATSSNDFYIYDSFWKRNKNYDSEWHQDFDHADAEWADFECFLKLCQELGYEPLVCMVPFHGKWMDKSEVSKETRAGYYQHARELCDRYHIAYADFSSCEYEPYFLADTVHPGWVGWVRIEKAFYDFVHDTDDPFLGGSNFGDAPGLSAIPSGGAA